MMCAHRIPIMTKMGLTYEVPCGQCIQCRVNRSAQWTERLMREYANQDYKGSFVTLTYSDEFLPRDSSLHKDHFQKFMKRLRRDLDTPIKYFSCGEYGDKSFRPHYHAIILGVPNDKPFKECVVENWPFADWSVKSIRDGSFGFVSTNSIAYVTGYVLKKWTGKKAEEEYQKNGVIAPFQLVSQGIGADWCAANADNLRRDLCIYHNGKPSPIPLYYKRKLGLDSHVFEPLLDEKNKQKLADYEVEDLPVNLTNRILTIRSCVSDILGCEYDDELHCSSAPGIVDQYLAEGAELNLQRKKALKEKSI